MLSHMIILTYVFYTGNHAYYTYTEQLVRTASSSSTSGELRCSLFTKHDAVHCAMNGIGTLRLEPVLKSFETPIHRCPISFRRVVETPSEIWDAIFRVAAVSDLLAVQTACKAWASLVTKYSHSRIKLELPDAWDSIPTKEDKTWYTQCYAAELELNILCFVRFYELECFVKSIRHVNWVYGVYCFFLHALKSLEEVIFEGVACTSGRLPMIRWPYSLPNTINTLRISRTAMTGHSVEGMLTKGTQLRNLEICCTNSGAMVSGTNPHV